MKKYLQRHHMYTIKRKTRKLLILVFSSLAVLVAGLALKDLVFPSYEMVAEKVLQVQSDVSMNYKVHMKDNPIFKGNTLSEGGYYLKPFTDYINITCTFSANADQPVDMQATTRIDVVLVSQLGSADEVELIWEKTEMYAPPETILSGNGVLQSKRSVKLDFARYDALINELIEDYDLVTDYYIKVVFNTTVEAAYGDESMQEPLSAELIIPFNNQIFSISGNNHANTELTFEKENEKQLGPDINKSIIYFSICTAFVLIVLILIIKTKPLEKQDKYSLEVAQIFKKYGNRLVGLNETLTYQTSIMISIEKIGDMVKIADEIGHTIFYFQVEEDNERKIEFYIFDETRVFYLAMFGEL